MGHYALVYFPRIDITTVNAFRKKYDPMFGVISPHVTIVFPFRGINESTVIQHIQSVTEKQKSFSVHFHGLTKSFDNYLFLLIEEGKEEVYKLHDKLYTNVLASELRTDIPFIPHMTLGLFQNEKHELNEVLFNKAWNEAAELNLDFHTRLDNLTLIKGDGIKPATIIHTFTIT